MKKLNIEKIIIVVLAALFALLVVFGGVEHVNIILSNSLFVVEGVLWLILLAFIMVRAGAIVVRSLIAVAAGLSLLIFLAQSYCASGILKTVSSNQSLKALIILGLMYVVYEFFLAIVTEFKEQRKKIEEVDKRWGWREKILHISIVIFALTFIGMVYQVISPIILGLCVYK